MYRGKNHFAGRELNRNRQGPIILAGFPAFPTLAHTLDNARYTVPDRRPISCHLLGRPAHQLGNPSNLLGSTCRALGWFLARRDYFAQRLLRSGPPFLSWRFSISTVVLRSTCRAHTRARGATNRSTGRPLHHSRPPSFFQRFSISIVAQVVQENPARQRHVPSPATWHLGQPELAASQFVPGRQGEPPSRLRVRCLPRSTAAPSGIHCRRPGRPRTPVGEAVRPYYGELVRFEFPKR